MALDPAAPVAGELHVFVAFDWGDEIDLTRAGALGLKMASRPQGRRPSTPFTYRPSPLIFDLETRTEQLPEIGAVEISGRAIVFDFGAVSIDLIVPLNLPPPSLSRLAAHLSDSKPFVELAKSWLQTLHAQIQPSIRAPFWSELCEDYFVFRFDPGQPGLGATSLLGEGAPWLAGLVRLETERLSTDEEAEALRVRFRYGEHDLLVLDWGAAVLVDKDCDDTLRTLAFANLHLLELRHIDLRLESDLKVANALVSRKISVLDYLIVRSRPLRQIGVLRVEATGLFERSGDALKLVGDQYLARIYRLAAGRFHMREWEATVLRTLDVVEDIYQVLADQVASRRGTVLETTVVILIVIEIVMGLLR